jgi:hypothetical protein
MKVTRTFGLQASYILLNGGRLEIGTNSYPFEQSATITLYGNPKSIDLPTFGAKVLACYGCKIDLHGSQRVAWTELEQSVYPGSNEIHLKDAVDWKIGDKIVIATTDFESPLSSHTEVATIAEVLESGFLLRLHDIGVCSTYTESGIPTDCIRSNSLSWPHLGEGRWFDGKYVEYRAEVGLLTRNIVFQGDHDSILCPNVDLADDGITRLSCNQFGAQMFFHSPGHESLIVHLANVEIRNAGQAFRLGRYAIHWHMVGNLRESYQKNCSIHNSWNRGTAIHGVNYLALENNIVYHGMGHAFFIEDGVEQYNRLYRNLAIKILPSMNLLNTDQA